MTLEHYARWYRNGANGEAECLDKTIVFDFGNTTIEHIYPQHPENPVADLDEMVDDLGNLTFLGPGDNVIGGNMSYLEKRQIFLDSSVTLNSIDIGKKDKWELDEITTHKKHLIDMALKVFSV